VPLLACPAVSVINAGSGESVFVQAAEEFDFTVTPGAKADPAVQRRC
jgi:hypothetical protein